MASTPPRSMRSRTVAARIARHEPRSYAISCAGWVAFMMVPIPVGLLLRWVLDNVSADPAGGPSVWVVLAVLAGIEAARWAHLLGMVVQWHGAWVGWHTVPRLNAMRELAVEPGPTAGRIPSSPGEAVSRFRDDCQDLSMVLDVWLDLSGVTATSIVALAIMATIDLPTTIVVALPVLAAVGLCRWLGPRLRQWRLAAREATGEVTGFVGDTFGAIGAVKAAGAEPAVLARFIELGDERARHARVDEVGTQLLQVLSGATGNLGIGLALLVIAPRISAGELTVGDLGLFATYITALAALPRWVGRQGAYQRQADVSVARLARLTRARDPEALTAPVGMQLREGPGDFPRHRPGTPGSRTGSDRLESFEVDGLAAAVDGVRTRPVHLHLARGSFTVVTGPVGSGKSLLLRAILGLVPADGSIRWNGQAVNDPSVFLVPPRGAYVPQVPRLFSETLADTVLLGVDGDDLPAALHAACLDDDLAEMAHGTATMVGPKGVRLSGGQIQRTAAARAFARRPELLVVDDLSSALDPATEAELWSRLFHATADQTVLCVTHREEVIARADHVLRLG